MIILVHSLGEENDLRRDHSRVWERREIGGTLEGDLGL